MMLYYRRRDESEAKKGQQLSKDQGQDTGNWYLCACVSFDSDDTEVSVFIFGMFGI